MQKNKCQPCALCRTDIKASPILRFIGVLTLLAIISKQAFSVYLEWSPTQSAKSCFYFPSEHSLPDKNDITQLLLSSAFFGTDALYFDRGEENTGIKDLPPMDEISDKGSQTPLSPSDDLPSAPNESPHDSSEQSGDPISEVDIYSFDSTAVPANEIALIPYDLSLGAKNGEVLLSNTTEYSIDGESCLDRDYPIVTELDAVNNSSPIVLIIHTHGTEAYAPEDAVSVPKTAIMRSTDTSQNVVAVGETMAQMLNNAGIPTLHIKTMHDKDSYTDSYDLAADTIRSCIQKYPSIQYVFDIHRDAVYNSAGQHIKPITLINGEPCAQVMFVVGTNEKGADHPNWETNFTVAAHLQSKLTSDFTAFARPINIRGASFNEQFTGGSLLIEIGSAGNSLTEAQNAAKYLTLSIIEIILENSTKKEP